LQLALEAEFTSSVKEECCTNLSAVFSSSLPSSESRHAPRNTSLYVTARQRRSTAMPALLRLLELPVLVLVKSSVLLYAQLSTDRYATVKLKRSSPTLAKLRLLESRRLADVRPSSSRLESSAQMLEDTSATARPSSATTVSAMLRTRELLAF